MAKSTAKTTGEMVPQPHGGALRWGGPNKGGPGRPPSAVREALRAGFDERVGMLQEIADGVVKLRLMHACEHCGQEPSAPVTVDEIKAALPDLADRLKALDMMAKYSDLAPRGGMNEDDVRARLKMTLLAISDELEEAEAERVLSRLRAIWA